MGLQLSIGLERSLLAQLKIRSMLQDKILVGQQIDEKVREIKERISQGIETSFQVLSNGLIDMGR